jgi:hypothetical protein
MKMTEAESMMAWLERRLTSNSAIPIYVKAFKKMWLEEFGTLDGIPEEFKKKVEDKYWELKGESTE